MPDVYIRFGSEPVRSAALSTPEPHRLTAVRREVVRTWIEASAPGTLATSYEVTVAAENGGSVQVDYGTVEQAYAALTTSDRIELFMAYCDPAFATLTTLPEEVKYILRSHARS